MGPGGTVKLDEANYLDKGYWQPIQRVNVPAAVEYLRIQKAWASVRWWFETMCSLIPTA